MGETLKIIDGTHVWVYSYDRKIRGCQVCLINEFWDDDSGLWLWLSTNGFMNSAVCC